MHVHREVGFRPEHLERGRGRIARELAQVGTRRDQRLDAVSGGGAVHVRLRQEQALVGPSALGGPGEVGQHRHVGLVAVDGRAVGGVGDIDDGRGRRLSAV